MPNPYYPVSTALLDVVPETPTIKTFVLRPQVPLPFRAGQFVELTVPGLGEAPFTPSSSPSEERQLALTVMKVGRVTSALHRLESGATVGLRGPYGKAYPLDDFAGRDILIMGGGVGLAPLRSLLLALLKDRVRFGRIILCYGARTPADLLYRTQLDEWRSLDSLEVHLTVDKADESWHGKVNVVTATLDDVHLETSGAVSVVCGPPIMMRFATLAILRKGFAPGSIYLSMERNMSCGLGKCGHCRVGPYYVCRDGPVFQYAQLQNLQQIW